MPGTGGAQWPGGLVGTPPTEPLGWGLVDGVTPEVTLLNVGSPTRCGETGLDLERLDLRLSRLPCAHRNEEEEEGTEAQK